jgi:hypothetical protein
MECAERAMELDPHSFLSYLVPFLAHQATGDWAATSAAADKALGAFGRALDTVTLLALAAVELGHPEIARDLFEEMRLRSRREYVAPMSFALVAAALGDRATAIAAAREAQARHDPALVFHALRGGGARHLRGLAEFQQILEEIKLPGWTAVAHPP